MFVPTQKLSRIAGVPLQARARTILTSCLIGLASGAAAQPPPPDTAPVPAPEVAWADGPPAFFQGAFFARDPWGEAIEPAPDARARRWGFYVWTGTPLWLILQVDGGPAGGRLCASWTDPNEEPAATECQRLPGGAARLAFESPENASWPEGPYAVQLYLESDRRRGPRELLGAVRYALGERLAMAGPPRDGPPATDIPAFPWPPPRATTSVVLERDLFGSTAATLGDVADRLTTALRRAGYVEHSFYSVPGGFALATRLEQIDPDGTPRPEPGRWSAAFPPRAIFSLGDFVRALFTAPEGHYRVIVFIVNDRPFATARERPTREAAMEWLAGGVNRLPRAIAAAPYGDDHACTALVYQFRKVGHEGEPTANPDGAAAAALQLERSGILESFE